MRADGRHCNFPPYIDWRFFLSFYNRRGRRERRVFTVKANYKSLKMKTMLLGCVSHGGTKGTEVAALVRGGFRTELKMNAKLKNPLFL